MYKPKPTESNLLIYQKYTDTIEYGYNLLKKYPKSEKYGLTREIRKSMLTPFQQITKLFQKSLKIEKNPCYFFIFLVK